MKSVTLEGKKLDLEPIELLSPFTRLYPGREAYEASDGSIVIIESKKVVMRFPKGSDNHAKLTR
jgi:hypothetical protein